MYEVRLYGIQRIRIRLVALISQKFKLLTDPFFFYFERGQMPDKANNTYYEKTIYL